MLCDTDFICSCCCVNVVIAVIQLCVCVELSVLAEKEDLSKHLSLTDAAQMSSLVSRQQNFCFSSSCVKQSQPLVERKSGTVSVSLKGINAPPEKMFSESV